MLRLSRKSYHSLDNIPTALPGGRGFLCLFSGRAARPLAGETLTSVSQARARGSYRLRREIRLG